MGTPVPRTRLAAAVLALTAASGCSWFASPEEDLDFDAYADDLTDMHNESVRLDAELAAAETRIVRGCLEAQGFALHNTHEFEHFGMTERESFLDEAPYAAFMPTVEEARLRGVWQWINLDGAEDLEDGEPWAAWKEREAERGFAPPFAEGEALPEFFDLPPQEQFDWWVAYMGEELAEYQQGYLVDIETPVDEDGNPVGGYPPYGGCKREMLDAVYGVDEDDGGRPSPPGGDWEGMNERYAERIVDVEADLLTCLEDRGFGGWEPYRGHLRVHDYLHEAGEAEHPYHSFEDDGGAWPDPPEDVPDADDAQGWLDFERDAAVLIAECGDESGYREAAEYAWQQVQLRYYLDIEEETYAWQETMRGHLERAQEVIGS